MGVIKNSFTASVWIHSLFLKVLSLHPSQSLTDLLHLSLIADNL